MEKLYQILSDTTKLQEDFAKIQSKLMELKNGMQSMDKEIADLQEDVVLKAGIYALEKFKEEVNRKIDDLEN